MVTRRSHRRAYPKIVAPRIRWRWRRYSRIPDPMTATPLEGGSKGAERRFPNGIGRLAMPVENRRSFHQSPMREWPPNNDIAPDGRLNGDDAPGRQRLSAARPAEGSGNSANFCLACDPASGSFPA